MTTLTFGSGGTYSTLAAAVAALPATFTDDHEIVQVGDSVETSDYATVTVDLDGYDLTVRNSSPHGGDPTVGHKITATSKAAGLRIICDSSSGTPVVEVKDLHWQWDTEMNSGDDSCVTIVLGVGNVTARVHDLILVNLELGEGPGEGRGLIVSCGLGDNYELWNISLYQWATAIDVYAFSTPVVVLENVTAINGTIALNIIGGSITVRNSAAISFTGTGSCDGYNNASVDTSANDGNWSTGSGNNPAGPITLANEFDSLDPTNASFAKVKSGGSCEAGGTMPAISGNTAGIRGNARPHGVNYSIGADEKTSGSYTVGSGGDYPNWSAAMADIVSPLTSDLTFTQISDTSEIGYTADFIDLNGFKITIASNNPYAGDPTQGWVSSYASIVGDTLIGGYWYGGTVEINGLNLKCRVDSTSGTALIVAFGVGAATDISVHDCVVQGNADVNPSGDVGGVLVYVDDPGAPSYVKIWNVEVSQCNWGMAVSSESPNAGTRVTVENCTAHDCTSGLGYGFEVFPGPANPTGDTWCNCVAFGCTQDFIFTGGGSSIGYNNASEDASAQDANWTSGSGNVTGIAPANEFVSTSHASSDYLKVKPGGSCEAGGTTPTIAGNTAGIRGNARPHSPDVSIGADEYNPPSPRSGGSGGGGGNSMMSTIMAVMAAGY